MLVAGWYVVASLLTLAIYGWDKRQATRSGPRTPESTLHLLSLLGGWPGALIGQHLFRHKRRKGAFMVVFWLTVVVNLSGLFVALTQF